MPLNQAMGKSVLNIILSLFSRRWKTVSLMGSQKSDLLHYGGIANCSIIPCMMLRFRDAISLGVSQARLPAESSKTV